MTRLVRLVSWGRRARRRACPVHRGRARRPVRAARACTTCSRPPHCSAATTLTAKERDDPRNGPQQRPRRPAGGDHARLGPDPRRPDRRHRLRARARPARTSTATTCCPAWSSCTPTTWSTTSPRARACSGSRCPRCSPATRNWRPAGATTVLDAVRIGSGPASTTPPPMPPGCWPTRSSWRRTPACCAPITRSTCAARCRARTASTRSAQFADDPHVRLVSLMDHTPGQRQYADIEVFKRYYIGKGFVAESEFDAFVAPLIERSARYADVHRRAIAGLAVAARHHPGHPRRRDARARRRVGRARACASASSRPPCSPPARPTSTASYIVMGAPNIVRGGSQSGNVAATELLGLGLLHVLSSDYVPSSPLQAVFQLAADGTVGLRRRRDAGQRRTRRERSASTTAARSRSASAPTWCGCGRTTCRPPTAIRAGGACPSSAASTGRGSGSPDLAGDG